MTGVGAHLLVLPIVLPLAAGAALLVVERRWPRAQGGARPRGDRRRWAWSPLALLAARRCRRRSASTSSATGRRRSASSLALDRLSALLVALTALLALPVLVFAEATAGPRRAPHFHAFFQFQLAGLNGAFLTADLFNLFVFFEVLLIASYALLLHAGGGRALRSGYHYVVINLAGSSLFLIAASLFYGLLGTLNLADLAQKIAVAPAENHALLRTAGMLLLVVFAIKAAVVAAGLLAAGRRIAPRRRRSPRCSR